MFFLSRRFTRCAKSPFPKWVDSGYILTHTNTHTHTNIHLPTIHKCYFQCARFYLVQVFKRFGKGMVFVLDERNLPLIVNRNINKMTLSRHFRARRFPRVQGIKCQIDQIILIVAHTTPMMQIRRLVWLQTFGLHSAHNAEEVRRLRANQKRHRLCTRLSEFNILYVYIHTCMRVKCINNLSGCWVEINAIDSGKHEWFSAIRHRKRSSTLNECIRC